MDRAGEAPPIELRDGETLVGREPGPGGVVLDDPRVSRSHLRLTVQSSERAARLVNEGRRGTEVDGVAVEQCELRDGAVIIAGHTALLFRWEARPVTEPDVPVPGLLGAAPALRAVRAMVRLAARTDAPVTILGETGTGKEVVARAVHDASGRTGAFIALNCAAIPEALAESQLFGHVAGAFTGARAPLEGCFRAADGGTLFLDEVGELSPGIQAKLLRALESGAVAPVGSARDVPHHARVLAATHRDLAADVAAGRFRGDLFARITDLVVTLPPLRDRREDVMPLLRHAFGGAVPPVEFALARALLVHPWPFNVRELVRLAAQLRLRAEGRGAGEPLELAMVAEPLERSRRIASSTPAAFTTSTPPPLASSGSNPGFPAVTASTPPQPPSTLPRPPTNPGGGAADRPPDRDALIALLRQHKGVVSDVARVVGRSRKQVYRWIESHALDPAEFRIEDEDDE